MKKIIFGVLLLVLLGVGIYKGSSLYERFRINMAVKMMSPDLSNCGEGKVSPELVPLQNQLCALVREENEKIKGVADSSETLEEFMQKVEVILEENDKKMQEKKMI